MRLGAQTCAVKPGTLAAEIYGSVVTERHRHRYEANNHYLAARRSRPAWSCRRARRAKTCAKSWSCRARRNAHPWYMGVQFHPEFKSTPRDGHPLFISFIKAALAHQASQAAQAAAACKETQHEAVRFRRRPGPAVLPDRRPLRDRVAPDGDGYRRRAEGNHRARWAFRSSTSRRSTRPTARRAHRSAAPAWKRAWRSWPTSSSSSACRC